MTIKGDVPPNARLLTIDECRQIQLSILNEIDEICLKNDIRYCLGYGTLLGAVRHKGFIPWDDDIDLLMPRPDYTRFLEIAANFLSSEYEIRTWRSHKDHNLPFAKVCDNRTIKFEGVQKTAVAVDIFPIDGLPRKKSFSFFQYLKLKYLDTLLWSALGKVATSRLRQFIRILLSPYARSLGAKEIISRMESYAKRIDFDAALFVGSRLIMTYGSKERIHQNDFLPLSKEKFEGKEFLAPHDAKKYLIMLFGNYMELPPEEQRILPHQGNTYLI